MLKRFFAWLGFGPLADFDQGRQFGRELIESGRQSEGWMIVHGAMDWGDFEEGLRAELIAQGIPNPLRRQF